MQRCVYAIPNGSLFHSEEMIKLEKDLAESRVSPTVFHTRLQVRYIFVNNIELYIYLFSSLVLYDFFLFSLFATIGVGIYSSFFFLHICSIWLQD